MSNYYNNNNRGIYGGQNNMYGQQAPNMYSNSNNYMRPQGNFYNNYNQGNYNQNNYQNQNQIHNQNFNNQNQQNNGPKPFISGYMGRILISAQDLETFQKSLKSAEWTQNKNYLKANNINIKLRTNNLQGQLQSEISIPRNRFNNYGGINSNFNEEDLINFIKEVNNYNQKQKEQIANEKNNFIRNNFPNERPDLNMNYLFEKIGENRKDVLMKDSSLYGKVERLLPLLKNEDAPKSAGNYDIKRSGIFDYEKKEDKKLFTNDNTSTPSGDFNSPWNNDNKKKFSNDRNTGTPGFY